MDKKQWTSILLVLVFSLAVSGCKEAAEGADQIADEVTGKSQIEKKIKIEKKIEDIKNKQNKNIEDAHNKIKE